MISIDDECDSASCTVTQVHAETRSSRRAMPSTQTLFSAASAPPRARLFIRLAPAARSHAGSRGDAEFAESNAFNPNSLLCGLRASACKALHPTRPAARSHAGSRGDAEFAESNAFNPNSLLRGLHASACKTPQPTRRARRSHAGSRGDAESAESNAFSPNFLFRGLRDSAC